MPDPSASSGEPRLGPIRQRQRALPSTTPASAPSLAKNTAPARPPAAARPKAPPAPPAKAVGDYEVGYGKPPKVSQFKPGPDPRRPKGRKPGSKNRANVIIAMMESPTSVRTPDGEVKTITTAEAMARKLREIAFSGELAALSKAFELYHKASPPAPPPDATSIAGRPDSPAELAATDQAMLAWYAAELAARGSEAQAADEPTDATGDDPADEEPQP